MEEKLSIPLKIKFSAGEQLFLSSGNYQVISEVGRGGFAHVYSIQDSKNTIYALKILDLWAIRPNEYEALIAKFQHEFTAGQIASLYIVRSYFTGLIKGNPYIIMDYCPNGSLAKRLTGFHSPTKFESLAISILKGLRDLHHEGIIHRDLKPENVLFDKEDCPRLTDFGIAGHLNSRLTSRNIIGMVQQVWGTPLYSPPEQLSHLKAYKHTSPSMDIFSFGVLMYEVISGGHHPFGDHKELLEDSNKYLDKVNAKRIISLQKYNQKVPVIWCKIIDKCLEPKPQNRYTSVDEIIRLISREKISDTSYLPIPITEASAHAILKVAEGDNLGYIYYLTPALEIGHKETLLIGWADPDQKGQNDIELTEKNTRYISRQHASLSRQDETWFVMDGQNTGVNGRVVGSTNGTFVNYQQIPSEAKTPLKNGDIISIGSVRLKFILL
ncbi:MAG: FHA domain-containing serine/threonine-protein kinase [Saprospiraceae bacterium]